jgi:predicted Zn-dependent protease with MMP-like domain
MISVTVEEFDKLITEALNSLPEEIQSKMENVEIVLEDEVDNPYLFGLYHGVPQTKRGNHYSWVLPDKITIFKKTIERYARSKEHLAHIVKSVVRHEIAHHFGYSDEELNHKKA